MDSNELMLVGLWLLAALSVAAIVFLLINPYLSGEHRTDKRIQGVTENRAKRIAIKTRAEVVSNRRRRGAEPDHGRLSYLQERRQAFENLGKRTGIAAIKAVATVLIRGTLWHPGRPGAARDGVGEP
jgi:hypothetical protein